MRRIRDPQQKWMFDPFEGVLSPLARNRIQTGWQGLFRTVVLELLPVKQLSTHFSPDMGCPTKELYSMAGLVFLADFFDWNALEAADAYMMRSDVQFSLNIEPGAECSDRTVERYRKLFTEDDLASQLFCDLTIKLTTLLELDVSKQRLDSTHIFSHMATFGRVRLMAVTLKRCLTQIKRHEAEDYEALPEDLRARYASSESRLFADAKDVEARTRSKQQIAEDMLLVVERFADHVGINSRTSYTSLVRIFQQQCQVVEGRVVVIPRTGGNVIQNPSDLDATYDGHKGAGYQVQLSETCASENDVQLITGVIPETAHANDSEAVKPMLEQLDKNGLTPEQMTADTSYGGDHNYATAASFGVELIAPVPGRGPVLSANELTLDDFAHNEVTGSVDACPAGHLPLRVTRDETTQTTTVEMPIATCASCPLLKLCPIKHTPEQAKVEFTDKARRTAARRCEEQTDVFRERYAQRSGIESTNSGLKNRLGLGRLHVRGRGAVFRTILLKVSGWNVLRAADSEKLRTMVQEKLAMLLGAAWARPFGLVCAVPRRLVNRVRRFQIEFKSTSAPLRHSNRFFRMPQILEA
jgi:Transposase DDE domain